MSIVNRNSELFRNGLVQEFYGLKALIILELTTDHFSGRKQKNNLNEQNFRFTGKSGSRIGKSGIEDRLKRT